MALTLYHALNSTCSQKARICLFEKGLEWESRILNLATKEQLSEEYLHLNPNGVVPTIVHDGRPVADSSVICEYLDERFPARPLSPADPLGKAQMRTWMRYFEEVATTAIRVPSYNAALMYRYEGLNDEQFRREQSDVRPLRKHFYRRMGPKGFNSVDVEASLDQLTGTLDRMEVALAGGPWLLGETYSIADIVILPSIDRMADLGLRSMWSDGQRPALAGWYQRMLERPAVQKAYPTGARLSDTLKVVPVVNSLSAHRTIDEL